MTLRNPPIDLHESSVEHFHARDRNTGQIVADAIITNLATAVGTVRQHAEALHRLGTALPRDPNLTPPAAALKLRAMALKAGEEAAARLDAARSRADDEIKRIEAGIRLPPRPSDPHLAAEIRAAFAKMKDEDRSKAFAAALKDDDETVISAILNAPPMLTGLGAAEFEMRRYAWQQRRHPAETDRLERLHKAVAALDRAGRSFIKYVGTAIEAPAAQLAEADARRADEARAAAEAFQQGT